MLSTKRVRRVEFAKAAQFRQQRFEDTLPNARFLPCNETALSVNSVHLFEDKSTR
jgi:hypothetical protein